MARNKTTKNVIQKITISILIILIILAVTFIILKHVNTQGLYDDFYNTMIKKTYNFIIIISVLWAVEVILKETIICGKGSRIKKFIRGLIFLMLMIMPICFLSNLFKDTLRNYVEGFKDLKYVIQNKPLSKTEICIFTTIITEKQKSYFESLNKNISKPIFETETLSLNVPYNKYYSTGCNEKLGYVVNVQYLPNTNTMLGYVSTNYSVGVQNATKIKENKLNMESNKENMYDEYSTIASIYCKNNEYDKAMSYYSKAIELMNRNTPYPWAIYASRAACYRELGQYKKAIDDLMKVRELALAKGLDEGYADAFRIEIAENYEALGDYDSAINQYKSMATSKKNSQYGIENTEKEKEKYEKLKNMADTYVPKDYKYYLTIGKDWYNQKFYEAGIKSLSTTVEVFVPDSYEPFYYRGLCYYKLCNYGKAIEDFNKALDHLPEDNKSDREKVLEVLGDNYMCTKEYEKALYTYKKANSQFLKIKMDKAQKFIDENKNFNNYKTRKKI
ncbi:tetratricopeptide repeat protein [Clostridium sp. JS66]|uniref:tetratricopeptide repeat protein n=1 Tax=Clostridium sp. JS66 TaxID=3064705 RepID=UPI00298DC39C|nr:tetratricopeptide repeat protein [Clostridium sp. JS66]WPC39752.1 tetratricopeptide repeat protein [Clostridium sp. JS66]